MQFVPFEVITTDSHTPVRCFISEDYGSYVPFHYHSALELIYVLSGSMYFTVGKDASYKQLVSSSQQPETSVKMDSWYKGAAQHNARGEAAIGSKSDLEQSAATLADTLSQHPNFRLAKLPDVPQAAMFQSAAESASLSLAVDAIESQAPGARTESVGASQNVPLAASAGAAGASKAQPYATPSLFNVGKVSASAFSSKNMAQHLTVAHAEQEFALKGEIYADQELSAEGFNCVLFNSKELHATHCPIFNRSLVVQVPDEFVLSSLGLSSEDEIDFALALATTECLQRMQAALNKLVQLILQAESQQPLFGQEIRFKQAVYTLLECLLELKISPDPQQLHSSEHQQRQRIYPILDLINRNYAQELTLPQVAEHLHVHPSYFCRIFKQVVGQSFHAYLTEVRLCHVYRELLNSNEPVANIVSRNGLVCNSCFYKMFKRRFHITPGELRAQYGFKSEPD